MILKYLFFVALVLLSGCGQANEAKPSTAVGDDWILETKHDVVSQKDTLHLGKVLTADNEQKLQVDLTCPTAGTITAEFLVMDGQLVWRRSMKDVVALGLARALGVDPVSTPIRWRVGQTIKDDDVPQREYNNDVIIRNFFTLSTPAQWAGSLAVVVATDHGELAVEKSIDSPNAQAFARKCQIDPEVIRAQEAKKAAARLAQNQKVQAQNAFTDAFLQHWLSTGAQS